MILIQFCFKPRIQCLVLQQTIKYLPGKTRHAMQKMKYTSHQHGGEQTATYSPQLKQHDLRRKILSRRPCGKGILGTENTVNLPHLFYNKQPLSSLKQDVEKFNLARPDGPASTRAVAPIDRSKKGELSLCCWYWTALLSTQLGRLWRASLRRALEERRRSRLVQ